MWHDCNRSAPHGIAHATEGSIPWVWHGRSGATGMCVQGGGPRGAPHSHWGGHIMYLEGSHYRSLKLGSAALCLSKPGSDWCNRTHFQMRIFLVFECQDDDPKMARKIAVWHPQMAFYPASGGGKRPPAAPAAGFGGHFASGAAQKWPPDRPKSPQK